MISQLATDSRAALFQYRRIVWPDIFFGPVNLKVVEDVLHFYNPNYYDQLVFNRMQGESA